MKKKNVFGFEFVLACYVLAQDADKLFAAQWHYTGDGKYIIRARIVDGINYVGMYQPDDKNYELQIDLEKMDIKSARLSPSINEESKDVDINLRLFEENNFPEEWQAPLQEFVQKYLGPACEVKWDEKVIDLIKCVNINYGVMFIIPNSACMADQFCIDKDKKAEEAKTIAELNDCEYDRETTKLVEIWMASERGDWYVDNLQCHDPCVLDKDKNRYYLRFPNFIPETVLRKFQEGALEHMVFPVEVEKAMADHEPDDAYNDHRLTTLVNFQFIPAQTITRYCWFGKFEDCLKHVCSYN